MNIVKKYSIPDYYMYNNMSGTFIFPYTFLYVYG